MGLRNVHAALLLLCIIAAGSVSATPKEKHKLGVEAVEAGRWADAERFFRAAMSERPQEKFNRILKTTYLPHYYLGVALAEQKQCQAALDAWTESSRQGQVQKSEHGSKLPQRQQDCQNHLNQVDAARTEVGQLLTRTDDAVAALTTLSATPELTALWSQGAPSFSSRQASAEGDLAEARKRVEDRSASDELQRLEAAKSLANTALTKLNTTVTDARQRLGELNTAMAQALEQLEDVEDKARRALRSIADLSPYPRRLGSRVAAVNRTLKEIQESKSGSSTQRLDQLAGELNDSVRALRRAGRRPPKSLSQAVEAFLGGSYADALILLDTPSLAENSKAKPHICLIRAASRHGLWVLGGEQDDILRDLASEAVLDCQNDELETDPEPPPNATFFSPRFVEFHTAALQAHTQAAEGGEEAASATGETPAAGGSTENGLTPTSLTEEGLKGGLGEDGAAEDVPADHPAGGATSGDGP